jgi:hypothetical protein
VGPRRQCRASKKGADRSTQELRWAGVPPHEAQRNIAGWLLDNQPLGGRPGGPHLPARQHATAERDRHSAGFVTFGRPQDGIKAASQAAMVDPERQIREPEETPPHGGGCGIDVGWSPSEDPSERPLKVKPLINRVETMVSGDDGVWRRWWGGLQRSAEGCRNGPTGGSTSRPKPKVLMSQQLFAEPPFFEVPDAQPPAPRTAGATPRPAFDEVLRRLVQREPGTPVEGCDRSGEV